MKLSVDKQTVILCVILIVIIPLLVGCFPAVATETNQEDNGSLPTLTETGVPTETFLPEVSSMVTETFVPTSLVTLTDVPTIAPSVTYTSAPVFIVSTKTKKKSAPKATATITVTPTVTLSPVTPVCAPPTPEPLWVDSVTSPTDQLSQDIEVHIGNGVEVTVTTESGTYTVMGHFGAYANPAIIKISLLPNTTNHLKVTARVNANGGGCVYDYTLTTIVDRHGAPLEIVQGVSYP